MERLSTSFTLFRFPPVAQIIMCTAIGTGSVGVGLAGCRGVCVWTICSTGGDGPEVINCGGCGNNQTSRAGIGKAT